MSKKIAGFVAMFLVLPVVASAASFTNVKFDNGQTTVEGTGGSSKTVIVRVVVPAGEVVEKMQLDVLGDNLAPMLPVDVGGTLGLEEGIHEVSLPVTLPPNTGYYTLEVRGAGIFGGVRSISIADGTVTVNTFTNALRVVSSSSTGSSTGSSTSSWETAFASLSAKFEALLAALKPAATPAPVVSPTCSAFAQAKAGAVAGVKNDANVRLQGFLLSQGASIPALAAGASFGFYGPQTSAAVAWFSAANPSCL